MNHKVFHSEYCGLEHWTNGGTAVTNFDKSDRAFYEQAIADCGLAGKLEVRDGPFSPMGCKCDEYMIAKYHSLHFIGESFDLSSFWATFSKIAGRK